MKLIKVIAVIAACGANCQLVYQDPTARIDDRVADLLNRMTIHEKTAQLIQGDMTNYLNITTGAFNQSGLSWNMANRAHAIWTGYYTNMSTVAKAARIGQEYLVRNTTHGIPAFVQSEGLHGFLALNATIFNSPIGMACSFRPDLVERAAGIIASEARALGVNQLFAPLADLARELRFGRVEETFGEDSYLVGEMAHSFVKGLQDGNVSAVVKHYAAFASPEQGLNTGPVHGGERELRSLYLPPFKRAIIDGEATAVMSSYNSYDGSPVVADAKLLTDILRGEWGYEYFVTSDAGGTARLDNAFHVCAAKDDACITTKALPVGNDVEMGGGYFSYSKIPELVASGQIDTKVVDEAVSRVLRAKLRLGLFEHPITAVPDDEVAKYINTDANKELSRQLDAESIVLLENNGVLPLQRDAKVAVIGPMAHGYVNYGDYVIHTAMTRGVTPLDGIRAVAKGQVTYAQGCERWSNDESGIAEAVAAAKGADVAVIVVGTWSRDQNELWEGLNATTGEHIDASDLSLVGAMPKLVKAIMNTGKPTVVVYSSGKPITEPWISQEAGALVQQFYQSEEGGNALASVLYGMINPSGKLSVSFPHSVGTLPVHYDRLNSVPSDSSGAIYPNGTLRFGSTYVLESPFAIYPFGYGLSYSNFSISLDSVSKHNVTDRDTVFFTLTVSNSSTRDGSEVVQLYVKQQIPSVDAPRYRLKGFEKVHIKAGSQKKVRLSLAVSDWGIWNSRMKYVVEPGQYVVYFGRSSEDFFGNVTITVV